VIGLNCSTGPEHMRQPIRYLCENTALPVSVIPNAGIPYNVDGVAVYGLTPEELADAHDEFVRKIGVNVVGGCCGTTPAHLKLVVERVWGERPLARDVKNVPRVSSAMEAFDIAQNPAPTLIGERVNSQGSRKVKQLLIEGEYDEIVTVGREQVDGGAHLLDVCTALTERQDEAEQMRTLVHDGGRCGRSGPRGEPGSRDHQLDQSGERARPHRFGITARRGTRRRRDRPHYR
jgi:5-methyltetrahydrofolate--homocysteine methyltransferase